MDQVLQQVDAAATRFSAAGIKPGDQSDTGVIKPAEKLASDVWSEIQRATDEVGAKLRNSEAFKRAMDSLSQQAKVVKAKETEWTIAIDFTTDFGDEQGVESGLNMLRDFAHKTKDKNITIVAQAAYPDTNEFDESGYPVVNKDTKYKFDRYIIKNGEMKLVDTGDSKGYVDDLKNLMNYASTSHPSQRMGLIIDSHGHGNEGLTGDTGHASIEEFVGAVKDGLKGSGREKIDMLDFDTCLMAQNGAMKKIRSVADQVVASAETEGIYNAQNYLDPIARLMEKPGTDGFTLARDIVSQTHKDMQEWKKDGWTPAVETLSHLNMRQYDQFSKSLDQFGEALTAALNDPANRVSIESAIDNSRKYGSSGNLLGMLFGSKLGGKHRTDLKEFTERVLTAVDNGEISDSDRVVKKAAQEVLNSRSNFVDSYHGEGAYKNAGGISVFLPGRNLRNVSKEAELKTSAGRMSEMTEFKNFASIKVSEKSRTEFLTRMEQEMFFTRPNFLLMGVPGVDSELKEIDRITAAFRKSENEDERAKIFKELHQATLNLAKSEPFKKIQEEEAKSLNAKVSTVYKANFIDENKDSGWSKFRVKLRNY